MDLGKFSEAFLKLGDVSRFDSHTLNLYKDGAYALVYDVTRKPTLENLERVWLKKLREVVKNELLFTILGNKCDLEVLRVYSKEEGINFAEKIGASGAFEVSAKRGYGIIEGLKKLTYDAYRMHGENLIDNSRQND
ncbi:MAG: hypothetical protein GF317_22750 [Candidatus Lokiarchaeota archaeon]|nr:hypothetical protein [Candidatus Lokiarchaeota archaeon]